MSALADPRGNALTAPAAAVELYADAVDRVLSARGGAEPLLRRALEPAPDFVLARWLLASIRQEAGDAAEANALRRTKDDAIAALTPREREHVGALGELFARGLDAFPRIASYATDHPRDLVFLEEAGRFLFFFGGRGKRAAIRSLYERAAAGDDANDRDWAFLGRFAFHLEECHESSRARSHAERSLALEARNAHAAHALAHVLFETGREEEVCRFLGRWIADYDGRLRAHLFWHIAVADLEAAAFERGRATYEKDVDENHDPRRPFGPLALADAVGFLFRLHLYADAAARPTPDSWRTLAERARALAAKNARPFVLAHAAIACGAAGADPKSVIPSGAAKALVELGEGLAAYFGERCSDAVAILEPLLAEEIEIVGGSNVERSLFAEIQLDAAIRAGDAARARALVDRRGGARAPKPLVAKLEALERAPA